MASATSSPRTRGKARAPSRPIPEARTLEAPLRALARARRVAPLLYFELALANAPDEKPAPRAHERFAGAVSAALRGAAGSLLRHKDAVVAGPGNRWFAALLVDRAVAAKARAAVSDADIGAVASRLRGAIQSRLDGVRENGSAGSRVGVRAGWTIIEPRDGERTLSELRHALRGAAVVARVEERRATVFASITHELRTPLTAILGYAEHLAGNGWTDKDKRTRALCVMADEARRLARLVEGLIDAGAWQAGRLVLRRKAVRLRDIVDRAAGTVAEAVKSRGVKIAVRGDVRAVVDADRVLQVLVNLLDNAVRHARSHGVVRVALAKRGSEYTIDISDDGLGFEAGHFDSLGTPFGVGRGGRVGLGLAISKMLVEGLGGALSFARSSGGGARVTVRLPQERTRVCG
jgi:signal transduction histidine kinase